ncbi:MAG TPA: GNAT family N-acetyltransferase [Streptosporangiaceae bacterium]|jgi:GNAT superfamily N-acetyltransferase
MAGLVAQRIDALSEEQLSLVQVIYERAFRADLLVPFGELTRPGEADQTFAAMAGAAPVGIAVLRLLHSVNWSFLRYFAIAGERRSQGLGRQFWQLLHQSLRKEAWPTRIVFEVESPSEAAIDQAERVIRQRRIRFWTTCGARLLPASGYILPDYTASGTTEPMLLMAATPAAAPPVQGLPLRDLVQAIYTDRYGLPPDDPLVSGALASITA